LRLKRSTSGPQPNYSAHQQRSRAVSPFGGPPHLPREYLRVV